MLDVAGVDPLALEVGPNLGLGAIAAIQVAVGEREPALKPVIAAILVPRFRAPALSVTERGPGRSRGRARGGRLDRLQRGFRLLGRRLDWLDGASAEPERGVDLVLYLPAISGLSSRNAFALPRPWPSRSSP